MKEISIFSDGGVAKLSAEIRRFGRDVVYMCIGTDKVFSDSLGPRVGERLNTEMRAPIFVYGMKSRNITAENLQRCYKFIRRVHPQSKIVVVDAAVGDSAQVGKVQVFDGGIVPGAATQKSLPVVGDASIVGIVAARDMKDFYSVDVGKERLVDAVAQFIANAVVMSVSNGASTN